MSGKKTVAGLLVVTLVFLGLQPAFAHGFGERYDLPVPLNLFIAGAAATVALSFVVISLFVRGRPGMLRYPRYDLLRVPAAGAVLQSGYLLLPLRLASVGLFALVVISGLFGTNKPVENLIPTFVWVIWWVGMGYWSALIGNLWMLINPWAVVFDWVEKLAGGGSGRPGAAMFRYPERWDVWPAFAMFFAFAWVENVYFGAARPFNLGMLVLLYSVVTWAGMIAFGKHTWLAHGEVFSVLFGFFARFSPTEVRVTDRRLCAACELECAPDEDCVDCYSCFERAAGPAREFNVRPYAVGLTLPKRVSTATVAFVVLALATVTFDGLSETSIWLSFQNATYSAATVFGRNAVAAIDTMGLVLAPLAFLIVYLGFSWGVSRLSGQQTLVTDVAKTFVFSLVPIALAYNMAHFISLLAIQGQYIIPLASDPLGLDWDILGTSDYRVNIAIVNAKFVWYTAVTAIVVGHIVSVFVAHVIALAEIPDRARALRSQYPMLLLMITYTATSLWIIAQPVLSGD
jgi:hypothetical protein